MPAKPLKRDEGVHVFGIRHHGPGSAQALLEGLVALEPDLLLIEGPPGGEDAMEHLLDATMQPPVALLIHSTKGPDRAAFYPFASFSPEWVAWRFALAGDLGDADFNVWSLGANLLAPLFTGGRLEGQIAVDEEATASSLGRP